MNFNLECWHRRRPTDISYTFRRLHELPRQTHRLCMEPMRNAICWASLTTLTFIVIWLTRVWVFKKREEEEEEVD
ncbi:unnamed protein product, partial [Nesidiocoris tenuis]